MNLLFWTVAGYAFNWRMFIGYAVKFFDKAAGFSVDVGWVIQDATPVS